MTIINFKEWLAAKPEDRKGILEKGKVKSNEKQVIDAIVTRLVSEIKEVSDSEEFYQETIQIVANEAVKKGYNDPETTIYGIEAEEFVAENINECVKQMVRNILNNYEIRLCKGRK